MKKVYILLAGFFGLAVMFSATYFISYQVALHHFNQNMEEKNAEILKTAQKLKEESQAEELAAEAVEADAAQPDSITPSTAYTLKILDVATGRETEEQMPVPEYLLGLNRQEVIAYLNQYMQDLSLEEYQSGLVSYELQSFSKDTVVLKKTYNSESVQFKYCLIVRGGMVVVYYSDKKTVYEYTGISSEDLPEEEQRKLNYGIFVKDDQELYGILENYSS